MEDYAALLVSECDKTQSQILLVPPTMVAFIASAGISKSEAGMARVHGWKKGIIKNKVTQSHKYTFGSLLTFWKSLWPPHWFFVIAEPFIDIATITSETHGSHWSVAHADLEICQMVYSSSLHNKSDFRKWTSVCSFFKRGKYLLSSLCNVGLQMAP
jgi:hypothetical protein